MGFNDCMPHIFDKPYVTYDMISFLILLKI